MRSMVEGWRGASLLVGRDTETAPSPVGAGLMGSRPGDPLLQFRRQPS